MSLHDYASSVDENINPAIGRLSLWRALHRGSSLSLRLGAVTQQCSNDLEARAECREWQRDPRSITAPWKRLVFETMPRKVAV